MPAICISFGLIALFGLGLLIALARATRRIRSLQQALARAGDAADAYVAQEVVDGGQRQALQDRRRRYLDRLGHDLRVPVGGVLGLAELLEDSSTDPRVKSYASDMVRCCEQLVGHLDDLLAFATSDDDSDTTAYAFAPRELIDEVARRIQYGRVSEGVTVRVRVADDVPARILADGTRTAGALKRLLSRAAGATTEGPIDVNVRRTQCDEGSQLTIVVRDSSGDAGDLDDDADLMVAHQLALGLGSPLRISPTTTVGLTAAFDVRCTELAPPVAAPPSAPDDDLLRGARILVVDGHPTSGLVVQRKLEAVGADVTFVQEAQRALQMMLEEPDLWDLALVDTHLTGVDGLELVRRIRASELVELPIILLGSMSDPDVRRAAAELSVDAVLARPVRQTELISAAVDGFRRWERANKLVRPPSRPCRVLVVDDDDMNRQIAERILARQGVAVSLASDGQEALEAHQQSPFDAVLMDCRMPVMNGLSATRAIRSLPGAEAAVPIIGWTASPHAGDRERCLDAGMTDYMLKPVDFVALEGRIRELVRGEEASRARRTVDSSRLRRMMSDPGDAEFFRDMGRSFFARSRGEVTTLMDALVAEDTERMRDRAHNMKSIARTLGLTEVGAAAAEVERRVAAGDLSGLGAKLDALLPLLETAQPALEMALDAISVERGETEQRGAC